LGAFAFENRDIIYGIGHEKVDQWRNVQVLSESVRGKGKISLGTQAKRARAR
jgi:hypothetical protein